MNKKDNKKLKKLIHECVRNESDEGERELEKSLIYEDIRFERFKETIGFLEEYNYVNAG